MANIDNISKVERGRNGAKGRVTRLREGKGLGVTESGGKNMGGQVVDGEGDSHGGAINPSTALAKTNDIFVWFLFQVALPLSCLIGVSVFVFCFIMKTPGAFEHLIGNGVLLIFGGLLLVGVFGAISRARSFAQQYREEIGLERWAAFLLTVGIVLLLLYAMNSTIVNLCELLPDMDQDLYGGLKVWTYVGIVGGAVAVVFSFAAICRMNRALFSCAQGGSARGRSV